LNDGALFVKLVDGKTLYLQLFSWQSEEKQLQHELARRLPERFLAQLPQFTAYYDIF